MRRVVIVEDDPIIQMLVAELLRGASYDVRVANDGQAGWAEIRQDPPELVVLDVMMPEMDGYEVLEQMRGHPDTAEIPVLLMTALDSVGDVARGFEVGANDYIHKPFNNEDLLARVESLLR